MEIECRGSKVIAETDFDLQPGETRLVRVAGLSPRVTLRLILEETQVPARVISMLKASFSNRQTPWGSPIDDLLTGLESVPRLRNSTLLIRSLLAEIIPGDKEVGSVNYIKNFIAHSGLYYESRLGKLLLSNAPPDILNDFFSKDLKGLLLKVYADLNEMGGSNAALGGTDQAALEKFKSLRSFIKNIEFNQLVNCLRNEEDEPLFFQIPLPLKEGIETLKLYFYGKKRGGTKAKKGDNFHLTFLLNLTGMGNFKIDVKLARKVIGLTLEVEKRSTLNLVERLLPELEGRLKNRGYQVMKAQGKLMSKQSGPNLPNEELFLSKFRMVDFTV